MAIIKDEEQQQGQGTSQALGQPTAGQPQQPEEQQPQQGSSAPATIGASQPSQPSMPMAKPQKAGTGTFANLRSYLQAAQGGGQQRVAQAATQQVQKLGAGAQKGTQQAQETFGRQMQAGSLKGMETAAQEAKGIVGTAKGVTYQAPQQAAQPQVPAQAEEQASTAPTTPAPTQPQQYFTPEQQQRFAEIINAQYQGPASLQQAGLYEQAAQKARTAQEAAQKTQTALGREQLLKDVFGRTRDYGRGASKLDALLLNASQQGVKQLQEQAQPAAKAQEALQAAQNLSTNEAAQRQAAIEGIRSGARQEFTGARAAEEQAVNTRLSQTVENWNQLPDYFKQVLRDREKGAMALTEQEAGLLGVKAGQGLYNLTPEALVQTNAAEKARLISKDELSRQLALQQLAGTDTSRQLQKDLSYTDLEKAGTQTAEDAISKTAVQDTLAAQEKAFREQAAGQNIVGEGSKKHRQTGKRYYAEETANLKDLLEKAGYDFTRDIGAGAIGSGSRDEDQLGITGEALAPYGSGASTTEQAATAYADLATGGTTAVLRGLGFDVTGAIAQNLGGTVDSKYAKNIASNIARQDLQNKVTQALEQAGFANRAAIGENEQVKARQAALQQILTARERLRG